jgi:FMN reductase
LHDDTYHGARRFARHAPPPYLTHKPIGLIATAAGGRGITAINTMAPTVQALRGWAIPFTVTIGTAYQAFAPDGTPRDAEMAAQLAKLGGMIVDFAERFAGETLMTAASTTSNRSS